MVAVSANRLELLQIADAVAREKTIDRGIVIAAMEDAIAKAAWSFFGRCCVRGRYVQRFFTWADIPLAHYQIVDLEDIVYLLRCCLSYRMGKLE